MNIKTPIKKYVSGWETLNEKQETLEIIVIKPLKERIEEQYKKLIEEGLISPSSLACYDAKEMNTKTLREALRRCNAKLRPLTPYPVKGVPYLVYCVDPKCLVEKLIEITRERLELEHQ
jgi:hypothetical protein